MFSHWFKINADLAMLAFESQTVIALRMAKLAAGGAAADKEAHRMIAEKALTWSAVGLSLSTGGSPAAAIRTVRSKVKANRRRLSRG